MNTNIQKLLIQIQKLCAQRHIRLTPQRLAVLQLLISQYEKSMSAYDLLHLLRKSYLPNAKPSTIYRTLNFLLAQRLIHRIESTNRFMLCRYFFELSHNFVFFICSHCEQVTEQITKDVEEILQNMAKITGFNIFNNVIEAHGLCTKCANLRSYPHYKT